MVDSIKNLASVLIIFEVWINFDAKFLKFLVPLYNEHWIVICTKNCLKKML